MDVRPVLNSNLTPCPVVQPSLSENYVHFSQLVNGFLTTMCVCLGTFGNLHSVKSVHFANFDKNRGVMLAVSILALAFWDTLLLWCAFFYYGFKSLARSSQSDFVNLTTPYFHGFSQISNTASIWCVVSITVQRYLATRDPFRTTRWLLHITSAEIKEYAYGRCSSRRHNRVLLNSFRGDRRKSSLGLLYCTLYRRHFKIPIIISLVAVLINIPAFFEIRTMPCTRLNENKLGYMLRISPIRLDPHYRLWYKVVFRMIVTTCGPNACILLLTIRTVMLLRGSNRSRKNLFQMSESLIDRYSSKATILTLISIMLVVKFLTFRSLSFMLDVWEHVVGFGNQIHTFIYLVDTSNFLVLLNSATNCFIIFRFSKWLQQKIVQKNTLKRGKQICVETNCFNSVEKLYQSWQQILSLTHHQIGIRILYSMVLANPQVYNLFREVSRASQTGTPVNLNRDQFRINRDRKVVRIASAKLESFGHQSDSDSPRGPTMERLKSSESMVNRKLTAPVHTDSVQDILLTDNKRRDTVDLTSRFHIPNSHRSSANELGQESSTDKTEQGQCLKHVNDIDDISQTPNPPRRKLVNPALVRCGLISSIERETTSVPSTPKDKEALISLSSQTFDSTTDSVFDLEATTADKPIDSKSSQDNHTFELRHEGRITGSETPPVESEPIPPEQLRKLSIELVSNRVFREIGDRITKFIGEIIEDMRAGQTEQSVISKIRQVGDLHYEKGIIVPPTAWRDFKTSIMTMLGQCEFATPSERSIIIDAWSSLLAIFIREFKLSMLGKAEHTLIHKHSTSTAPPVERSTTSNRID